MNGHRIVISAPHRIAFAALVALLSSATCAHADALPDIPVLGHALHRLGPVGAHGWGETDVDGDGRADLVTSGDGPAALILVYGRINITVGLAQKQSLLGPPHSISALATAPSGDTRVVTVSPDRMATRYGGWPLAPIGSFQVSHATQLMRIGDIDADGTLELLCAGEGKLSAYSLPDGIPKWTMSLVVTDIVLASLDADPALELIIAGGDSAPGYVIDGATGMLDWSRPEGFGTYLAEGKFGKFFEPGFVAARDWDSLAGFTVAPYALGWSMSNVDTDGVAAGDTDADGRDEFAVGDGQWGSVRVYDAPTRQMLYEMYNQGHGMWALGMLDFDANARDEVWYSARIENDSYREDNFAAAIMNPITARPRLTIESYQQDATASLLADLDQDGDLEWVIGTSTEFANKGLLRMLDATSRNEVWRAPYELGNLWLPFQMWYRGLHAAQLDADPALELVAVGGNYGGRFRFVVIDGATRSVEGQFPALGTPWASLANNVTSSRLVQHAPGGAPELLTASYIYNVAANVKLDLYSLPFGELLWSSPTVGGPYDRSLGLDVGQLDADPSPEYLLVHTGGLSAFDAGTGQAEWTLPIATRGAIIVATQAGSRIYSFDSQDEVTVYDPATLLPVGGFSLPVPLEQLARLPGRDDVLLAISGEQLRLINLSGQMLQESGWIGGGPGVGDNLSVVSDGNGWLISIGRSFSTFQFRLELDEIFSHGFE